MRQPGRPLRSALLHYLWSALSRNVPGYSGHPVKTCRLAMSWVQSVPELQVSLNFNSKVCIEFERDPIIRCSKVRVIWQRLFILQLYSFTLTSPCLKKITRYLLTFMLLRNKSKQKLILVIQIHNSLKANLNLPTTLKWVILTT